MKLLIASILVLQVINGTNEYKYTEIETLKIENIKLKSQVLQLNKQLLESQLNSAASQLSSEMSSLVEELRIKLKAGKDDVFNWDTLKFESKSKTEDKK